MPAKPNRRSVTLKEPPPQLRVGFLVEDQLLESVEILRGMASVLAPDGRCVLRVRGLVPTVDAIKRGLLNILVARRLDPPLLDALRDHPVPVLRVSNAQPDLKQFPMVATDDRLVAKMAMDHLLDRGYRQLATLSYPSHKLSAIRAEMFYDMATSQGVPCHIYRAPAKATGKAWMDYRDELDAVLASWKPPVGVFVPTAFAADFAEQCQRVGRRIPEDFACVSVGTDEIMFGFQFPNRSYVEGDNERIGQLAAEVLLKSLTSRRPMRSRILVPPRRLVVGRSSDHLATSDPIVAAALRMITQGSEIPLRVSHVAEAMGMAPRTLELRFRSVLGRTPKQVIQSTRIARARQLLEEGTLSVGEVSRRCGFADHTQFSAVFGKMTGTSPRDYKRKSK